MNSSSSKLLAWWQLLRIGNVFTAVSNVFAGFLIAQGGWQPIGPLLILIAASALLYEAGMVLNDVFDAELDAVERPERPIPSGRISRGVAMIASWGLLGAGLFSSYVAGLVSDETMPWIVSTLLVLCVVGYDGFLKRTPLGPVTMGLCRCLNVLLGSSVAGSLDYAALAYAALVGVYTVGITLLARSENQNRMTADHAVGERFIVVALALLLPLSLVMFELNANPVRRTGWIIGWFLVVFVLLGQRWFERQAVSSAKLQRRVATLLRGFILIDALASFAVAGWVAGVLVLTLFIPSWIASHFAPMT